MGEVSYSTEQLQRVAQALLDADLEQRVTQRARKLELPITAWPLMAVFGCASEYEEMRDAAEKASKSLEFVVGALGGSLAEVGAYYERMETQYGKDFDSLDLELERKPPR